MNAGFGKRLYEIFVQLALIIVGVLSALGVDNYRETIQEHKLEKEYLVNLRNAVQADTVELKTEIQKTYNKINAITKMISLSNSNQSIDNDEFGNLITDVTMLIRPNFITAVYEELKYTGNFKLIRNNKLKTLIIAYYSDNAIIQQKNLADLGGNNAELIDHLAFDEMEYKVPYDQKRIYKAIQEHEELRDELLRNQKSVSSLRSGMIYTSMPRSIELLEKLQVEIDK